MLIMVDMQRDFLTEALPLPYDPSKLIKAIAQLILSYQGLVVAFQDEHPLGKDDPECKQIGVVHCVPGTDGHRFPKEIEDAIEYRKTKTDLPPVVFFKKNSFGGIKASADLVNYAHKFGKQDDVYEFCGVATSICVHDCVAGFYHAFKENLQELPKIRVFENLVGDSDKEMAEYALKRMHKLYNAEISDEYLY